MSKANTKPKETISDEDLIDRYGEKALHSLNSNQLADNVINETERKKKKHLFQPGNKAAVGHKRGKQKLSSAFVDDLSYEWHRRGQEALSELTGDKLVQACIAILPKDVLVSMNQSDQVSWVINQQPRLNESQWREQHGLDQDETVIESTG